MVFKLFAQCFSRNHKFQEKPKSKTNPIPRVKRGVGHCFFLWDGGKTPVSKSLLSLTLVGYSDPVSKAIRPEKSKKSKKKKKKKSKKRKKKYDSDSSDSSDSSSDSGKPAICIPPHLGCSFIWP